MIDGSGNTQLVASVLATEPDGILTCRRVDAPNRAS
jgi:hypothetical protein